MNLLFITQDFPPNTGGIETYSWELSRRFSSYADRYGLLAPTHKQAKAVDKELGYMTFRIPVKNSLLPLALPVVLKQIVTKYSFDTVFHAQWQTVWPSIITRKLTGWPKKIYIAAHGRELLISPFSGNSGRISKTLHAARKKVLSQVNGFFPVSQYTAQLLEQDGIAKNKIHVVGNGTDPDFFTPKSTGPLRKTLGLTNKKVLFSVCRLVPRKGIDLVLQALSRLLKVRQDIVYLIGGTGEDRKRLESLVSRLKLDEHVQFIGFISEEDMPDYYSLADVFVMPAKSEIPDVEGFGIVFLEANACETPVVGSKTGGIPDAIEDGTTGLLVEERNIDQLVEAVSLLFKDEELARRMGKQGRERVLKRANWDHISRELFQKMILINGQ